MNDVVDLEARRKAKEPPEGYVELYACDCGSGLWRLYADGSVECVNCAGIPPDLRTVRGAES
jgi:hypothetical protein